MSQATQDSPARGKSPLRYIVMAVIAGVIAVHRLLRVRRPAARSRCHIHAAVGPEDFDFRRPEGQGLSRQLLGDELRDLHEGNAGDDQHLQPVQGAGLEFVAVAMSYDAPMYVTNYTQTRNLPFKVAMDDGSVAKQFGNVQLTPTTFVIDRNGKILKRYVGEPTFAELDALLDKALNAA